MVQERDIANFVWSNTALATKKTEYFMLSIELAVEIMTDRVVIQEGLFTETAESISFSASPTRLSWDRTF